MAAPTENYAGARAPARAVPSGRTVFAWGWVHIVLGGAIVIYQLTRTTPKPSSDPR